MKRKRKRERPRNAEGKRRARGASKVKESTREPMDLGGLSKRVSCFVVCTSSTKNPFPSNVHKRPRGHIHPVRVYLGPRVIYAMAQIKYFNRGGRATPKNRKIALRFIRRHARSVITVITARLRCFYICIKERESRVLITM